MWDHDDVDSSLHSPLLLPLHKSQYGSSTNREVKIMNKSPLTMSNTATVAVQDSSTFYKNGKPFIEYYKIQIMSSSKTLAYPLSQSIWRTYKEFCWLRKYFKKQYCNQKIPPLPPNYLFRRNYEEEIVRERISGLQDFLQECLENKHLISDETFHFFTQTNLTIKEMKQQQSKNNDSSFSRMCFWVCHNRKQDIDDDIDYDNFKKELESVLMDNENSLYN